MNHNRTKLNYKDFGVKLIGMQNQFSENHSFFRSYCICKYLMMHVLLLVGCAFKFRTIIFSNFRHLVTQPTLYSCLVLDNHCIFWKWPIPFLGYIFRPRAVSSCHLLLCCLDVFLSLIQSIFSRVALFEGTAVFPSTSFIVNGLVKLGSFVFVCILYVANADRGTPIFESKGLYPSKWVIAAAVIIIIRTHTWIYSCHGCYN